MGEGQREGGRQRIPSTDSAEPDVGLELTNDQIMTSAEVKSQRLNRLSHPGAPCHFLICFLFSLFALFSRRQTRIYLPNLLIFVSAIILPGAISSFNEFFYKDSILVL